MRRTTLRGFVAGGSAHAFPAPWESFGCGGRMLPRVSRGRARLSLLPGQSGSTFIAVSIATLGWRVRVLASVAVAARARKRDRC